MDESALINAMTQKGHTEDTARGAIAGRGMADLWNEYMGGSTSGGSTQLPTLDVSSLPSSLEFAQGLSAGEDKAFQDYLNTVQAQEDPLAIYSRLEEQAGLPSLRKTATTLSGQINELEDTLMQVEGDITSRSGQSFMTEAQRRGRVAETRKPMLENLADLARSLGRIDQGIMRGEANIATKTGLAMQGQDRALEPLKMRLNMMIDRSARLTTGFTADKEVLLQKLLSEYESGVQLTRDKLQQLNQLAILDKQYEQEKELAMDETQVVTAGGRVRLINSRTGELIADLGSSKAPNTGGGSGNPLDYLGGGSARVSDGSSNGFPDGDDFIAE